jgi:polysaccharide biosynthesis protein PslJ
VTSEVLDLSAVPERQHVAVDAVTLLSCYVFLLMLIPSPLVFEPLGSAGSPATMFAAILLTWYLVTWLHPRLAPARGVQPVRFVTVLFACSVIASYISLNRSLLPTLTQDGGDVGLILVGGWLGVCLLTADRTVSLHRLDKLLGRVMIGATVMSVLAIVQFITNLNASDYISIPGLTSNVPFVDLLSRDQLNRPSATALDPIELAAVLAACLPIALNRARFGAERHRAARWAQVVLIAGALPLTLSRTGFTALAAAAIVLLPTWPKRDRRLAYLTGLGGLVAMYATKPGLIGTLVQLFGQIGSDSSSTSRTGAFSAAAPFISQHPWLGVGFNTFFPQTTFFTDDQYLLQLIETGFIGLIALTVLFVGGWQIARSARRASLDPRVRDLAQCLAAAIAACAVSFATLDAFSFNIISGVTFLILGCTGALWRLTRSKTGGSSPPSLAPLLPRCRSGCPINSRFREYGLAA